MRWGVWAALAAVVWLAPALGVAQDVGPDTGMAAEEICRIMLEEAGVAAIPGAAFGAMGKDFVRLSSTLMM